MLRKVRGVAGKAPALGTRHGTMPKPKDCIGIACTILVASLAMVGTLLPAAAQAQGAHSWKNDGERVRHVVVTLNKSKTFHLDQPFSTAVVGSPDIADALPMPCADPVTIATLPAKRPIVVSSFVVELFIMQQLRC